MATTAPADCAQFKAKRKVLVSGLPSSGRTVKRRASRACHCCRSRKVRCDVVESGTPCTNCRLDEVECMVSDSKRRKRPRADGEVSNQSPESSNDSSEEVQGFNSYDNTGVQNIPATLDEFLAAAPPGSLEFETEHHFPHMLCMSPCLRKRVPQLIMPRSNARSPSNQRRTSPPNVFNQSTIRPPSALAGASCFKSLLRAPTTTASGSQLAELHTWLTTKNHGGGY
jgi:Fungal Zn(2)-Cys(6) binuclear cluster domain